MQQLADAPTVTDMSTAKVKPRSVWSTAVSQRVALPRHSTSRASGGFSVTALHTPKEPDGLQGVSGRTSISHKRAPFGSHKCFLLVCLF